MQVLSSLSQVDVNTHTLNHVFGGIEQEKVLPPLQFTFQEYLLQDEAALVHTKKVGSIVRCMQYLNHWKEKFFIARFNRWLSVY